MLRRLRMDDNLIVFRTNLDAADLRIANIKHFAPIAVPIVMVPKGF
jgi:hypothetical protein